MTEENVKPKLREPLDVVYEDGRRETIIIRRLSNTDMMKWIDLAFDKSFLVFRSVDLPAIAGRADDVGGRGSCRADQFWFDSLTQDSAFAIVERALALNDSPIQKKVMAAVMENLKSWSSLTPSTSFATAATPSAS